MTSAQIHLLTAAIAAIFCGACGSDCPPGGPGDYYGFVATVVESGTLTPICDAQVSYEGSGAYSETTLDAEARDCKYYGPYQLVGTYEIHVYHPAFAPADQRVTSRHLYGGDQPEDEGCGVLRALPIIELEPFSI